MELKSKKFRKQQCSNRPGSNEVVTSKRLASKVQTRELVRPSVRPALLMVDFAIPGQISAGPDLGCRRRIALIVGA